jgi:homoserine dehydrogenase
VLRQVARAERRGGRVSAAVRLEELAPDDPLASCEGEENRLIVVGSSGGATLAGGKGAGRLPTSLSVVSDVLDQVRRLRSPCSSEAKRMSG